MARQSKPVAPRPIAKEFDLGRRDFERGRTRCPYAEGTDGHMEWLCGYSAAEREAQSAHERQHEEASR